MAHDRIVGPSDLCHAIGARLGGSVVELQEATASMQAAHGHESSSTEEARH
jgi:hypothetical protein